MREYRWCAFYLINVGHIFFMSLNILDQNSWHHSHSYHRMKLGSWIIFRSRQAEPRLTLMSQAEILRELGCERTVVGRNLKGLKRRYGKCRACRSLESLPQTQMHRSVQRDISPSPHSAGGKRVNVRSLHLICHIFCTVYHGALPQCGWVKNDSLKFWLRQLNETVLLYTGGCRNGKPVNVTKSDKGSCLHIDDRDGPWICER